MLRLSRVIPLALMFVVSACAGGGDGRAEGGTSGNDETEAGSETEPDPSTSTSTTSTGSTSTTSTSTTSTSTTDEGDSTTDEGDETEAPCPSGSIGCPCDADACDEDLVCFEDVCEMPLQCPADAHESNDSEQTAHSLGEFNDCDGNGGSLSGVLSLGDEDWFTYVGDDDFGCVVDPDRQIVTDGELRICKFAECLNGLPNTEITCPPGTMSATSPAGRPGCCGSSGFTMGVFNCTGTSEDSAHIYIRLDQGSPQCVQYTLNYHY